MEKNANQPSEEELDAIYKYISMTIDEMTDQEQLFWLEILEKLDPEFYLDNEENENDEF